MAMIIDIAGLPGAGKSTQARKLKTKLDQEERQAYIGKKLSAKPYSDETANRFLWNEPQRLQNYRLAQFRFENMKFMSALDKIAHKYYTQYNLLCEMIAGYIAAAKELDAGAIAIFDEGFVSRVVQIYARFITRKYSEAEIEERKDELLQDFGALVDLFPRIDLAILIELTPDQAIDRAVSRALKRQDPSKIIDPYEIEKWVRRKHGPVSGLQLRNDYYAETMRRLDKRGGATKVVRIDGSQEEDQVFAQVFDNVKTLIA